MIIYKYNITLGEQQYLWMPDGAKMLDAQWQDDTLCLWAMVNPSSQEKVYEICVWGTGHHISRVNGLVHISTVQKDGYVWHVFCRE